MDVVAYFLLGFLAGFALYFRFRKIEVSDREWNDVINRVVRERPAWLPTQPRKMTDTELTLAVERERPVKPCRYCGDKGEWVYDGIHHDETGQARLKYACSTCACQHHVNVALPLQIQPLPHNR